MGSSSRGSVMAPIPEVVISTPPVIVSIVGSSIITVSVPTTARGPIVHESIPPIVVALPTATVVSVVIATVVSVVIATVVRIIVPARRSEAWAGEPVVEASVPIAVALVLAVTVSSAAAVPVVVAHVKVWLLHHDLLRTGR